MAVTPDLMGISRELRFNIINYVHGNINRRPQILAHHEFSRPNPDHGWSRNTYDFRVPIGLRHLVALMQVNKTMHAELNAQFFSKAILNFCLST
jgi:hypothetical protein